MAASEQKSTVDKIMDRIDFPRMLRSGGFQTLVENGICNMTSGPASMFLTKNDVQILDSKKQCLRPLTAAEWQTPAFDNGTIHLVEVPYQVWYILASFLLLNLLLCGIFRSQMSKKSSGLIWMQLLSRGGMAKTVKWS